MHSRLSEIDSDVLALAEINFDSVEKMSKLLKRRPHQIQYALRKLKSLGVLGQIRAWIDVHSLGFHYVTVYFRFVQAKKSTKSHFISLVAKNPLCTWVFETSGEFHLAVSLTVREIHEVFSFFDSIERAADVAISAKALSIQRDFEFFGRRYLRSARCRLPSVALPSTKPLNEELDHIDRALLAALSSGGWETERELANQLKVPYSTINRRLLSLRKRKIIRGYCCWLDPQHFGRQPIVLRVKVSGLGSRIKDKLWAFARGNIAVVYLVECLGSWDYELGADIKTTAEMLLLVDTLTSLVEGVDVSVDPVVVTSFHKTQSFPGGG
jgi:DNA-binding Lrp family transcriptional regulator